MKQLSDEKIELMIRAPQLADSIDVLDAAVELKERRALALLGEAATTEKSEGDYEAFKAGYKYYRDVIAEAKVPYDAVAEYTVQKGFKEMADKKEAVSA